MNILLIGQLMTISIVLLQMTSCSSDSSSGNEKRVDGFYYSFDEESGSRVNDHSGNNFHGEAVLVRRVSGKIGNALTFMGPGSAIDLPQIPDYFPFSDGFTFRAWLIIGNVGGYDPQQIIGSTINRDQGSDGDGFGIAIAGMTTIVLYLPEDPNIWYSASPQLPLMNSRWVHIALTYDGETLSYYLNGELVFTDSFVTTFKAGFYNHIGSMRNAESDGAPRNQFFDTIDELYLESRVMQPEEIMNYYLSTK